MARCWSAYYKLHGMWMTSLEISGLKSVLSASEIAAVHGSQKTQWQEAPTDGQGHAQA